MISTSATTEFGACPLCGAGTFVEDSVPMPNLYSEMLAGLLDCDEREMLEKHLNYRCMACGLIFKRHWFRDSIVRDLFMRRVPAHPRGWDTVLGRFSAHGFTSSMTRWGHALKHSETSEVRRAQRELISILDSISRPIGFDPIVAAAAIWDNDVDAVNSMAEAIRGAIHEPAPFKRFSGFRSRDLWDYLQLRTGGFTDYAELGCPLWGMLHLAVECGVRATYLQRDEPNYWGSSCVNSGANCRTLLLRDTRIAAAQWSGMERYDLIGLFQYLDHLTAPRVFLEQLFARSNSAAVILDAATEPVAIQHVTGWNEPSLTYVAHLFGKSLHADFDDIRESGNVLYVLAAAP